LHKNRTFCIPPRNHFPHVSSSAVGKESIAGFKRLEEVANNDARTGDKTTDDEHSKDHANAGTNAV